VGPKDGYATARAGEIFFWVCWYESAYYTPTANIPRKYFVSIVILLNLATLTGFCVVNSIIGGQALSAVTDGRTINATVGIIVVAVLALFIAFCGFKALHFYERFAWVPALIAIIVASGCGGKQLSSQVEVPAATAPQVLSFGGLVASFMLPWAALASDFSTYMCPKAPS
jgi:purine-cytosine permease-like protein